MTRYYHFIGANKHLRFDLQDTEVSVGLKLTFNGDPILCEQGLHASARPLDALRYAPLDSEWLCIVELGGTVVHGAGKSVATECTVVWMLNVRKLLVEFALWNVEQAFQAVRKVGIEPDERSIEAVRILRLWLMDKASKEELIAAATAARAAANDAYADADDAYAADAAYADAAYSAARAADAAARAVDAAADDTYAAACVIDVVARAIDVIGAYVGTYYAARAAQNGQLESMINTVLEAQNESSS
jgi:hypothetical protein